MTYPIEGSCQCGNVTYKLKAKPQMVMACHCQECQKLSTSPFSITAVIDVNDIEFSGKLNEWSRSSDSGNKNHAMFCPTCGNRIYHYNPENLSTIKLKLKPVNGVDESIFEPTAHVWVSEKVSWFQIPDNMKTYLKQP